MVVTCIWKRTSPHEASSGEGGNGFLVTITSSQKRWVIIDIVGSHLSKHESCFWVGKWVWIWVRILGWKEKPTWREKYRALCCSLICCQLDPKSSTKARNQSCPKSYPNVGYISSFLPIVKLIPHVTYKCQLIQQLSNFDSFKVARYASIFGRNPSCHTWGHWWLDAQFNRTYTYRVI